MQDKIKRALKQAACEYVEVRLEEVTRTAVTYLGKELETIGTADDVGGNVRAYHKGGWGFVSFNDAKDLPTYVREACRQAKMVGGANGAGQGEPVRRPEEGGPGRKREADEKI
jgi:TldD protein